MKRSQATIFIIIGLLIIIISIFFFINRDFQKQNLNIEILNEQSFQKYFDECAHDSIIQSNIINGFISNNEYYQQTFLKKLDQCMGPFLLYLDNDKGYDIIKISENNADIQVNEINLIVNISYPIEIKKRTSIFRFENFIETFDRSINYKLSDIGKKLVYSTDRLVNLNIEENTQLTDLYGDPAEDIVIVKLSDKREKNGEELYSNLIYCILPIQHVFTKDVELKLDVESLIPGILDYEDLRVAWWDPRADEWGFLPSKYEMGYITAEIEYTTCFGLIINNGPEFGNFEQGLDDEAEGFSESLINVPPPEYQMHSGKYDEIFYKIRQEMGGTYTLNDVSKCVLGPSSTYCYVGTPAGCGTKIHCKREKLASLDEHSLNMLFRHEITHNLQQVNGGCISQRIYSEWGAEYYSGSNYYSFLLNGEWHTAAQLGEKLKQEGCSEEELNSMAFCEPGSIESASHCFIGKEIAENIKP